MKYMLWLIKMTFFYHSCELQIIKAFFFIQHILTVDFEKIKMSVSGLVMILHKYFL